MRKLCLAIGLVGGLLTGAPLAAHAQNLENPFSQTITRYRYQPVWPPSTEGQIGSVYLQIRSNGRMSPGYLCDIFPGNPPTLDETEVWPNVEVQRQTNLGFMISLLRAVGALKAAEGSAAWNQVRRYELDWGAIQTRRLRLLELSQVNRREYRGPVHADCVRLANQLIGQRKQVLIIERLATAASLTARFELNPPASQSASNPNQSNPGGSAASGSNASNSSSSSSSASTNTTAPGVSVGASVTVNDLVQASARVHVSSQGQSTVVFDQPMNVGRELRSLRDLRRLGLFGPPRLQLQTGDALETEDAPANEAVSITPEELEAYRERLLHQ